MILALLGFINIAFGVDRCELLLTQLESLEWTIPGITEKVQTLTNSGDIQYEIRRMYGDTSIGNLYYTRGSYGSVELSWIEVAEANRNTGVSQLLFSEMLKDNPRIATIKSTLVFENLKSIAKLEEKGIKDCVGLVVATPAYKVRKKFGFSKILQCEYLKNAFIYLVVGKE